jgi:hypothetical protein
MKLTRVSGPASAVSTQARLTAPLAPKHILLNALLHLMLQQFLILVLSLQEPSTLFTGLMLIHAFPSSGNTLLNCIGEAHLQKSQPLTPNGHGNLFHYVLYVGIKLD